MQTRHTGGLAAGMFPEAAADAAGRDLTLRGGAQTPAPSVGGGALVTRAPVTEPVLAAEAVGEEDRGNSLSRRGKWASRLPLTK